MPHLSKKVKLLQRLMTPEALESNRIGSATTKTFANDIEDLCLVKECREFDFMFNSDFTTKALTDDCNQGDSDEEYYPVFGQRSNP